MTTTKSAVKTVSVTYILDGQTSTRKFTVREDAKDFIIATIKAGGAIVDTMGG